MAEKIARPVEVARERARWAWKCVEEAKSLAAVARYGTLAKKLPSYLQGSGLGQTLAFLLSKPPKKPGETNAELRLYKDLEDRLRAVAPSKVDDAMFYLLEASPTDYRHFSRELLLSSQWLKRFADAKLESEE